jgi:hypothetical protein
VKTIIDINERSRIELTNLGDKVNMIEFYRMDNMDWVVHGGALLTKDQAASLGICLIERSGKEKEILKAKYQRKD